MGRLYNRRSQNGIRRHLRAVSTPSEVALWQRLRRSRLCGRRFRRQHGVGPYVLDFYCAAERLAVELDGTVHDTPGQRVYDAERTAHLESVGIRVIRFDNEAVRLDVEAVLGAIAARFGSAE